MVPEGPYGDMMGNGWQLLNGKLSSHHSPTPDVYTRVVPAITPALTEVLLPQAKGLRQEHEERECPQQRHGRPAQAARGARQGGAHSTGGRGVRHAGGGA